MTDSLKGRLGLLLRDKNGNTQTPEERLAELQRQKQFILQKYAEPEKGADNQPELQPAEVSVQ